MQKYIKIHTKEYIFYTIINPCLFGIYFLARKYLNYHFENSMFNVTDSLVSACILQLATNFSIIMGYSTKDDKPYFKQPIVKINTNFYIKIMLLAIIIFLIIPILFDFFMLNIRKFYIISKYIILMIFPLILINIATYIYYSEYEDQPPNNY